MGKVNLCKLGVKFSGSPERLPGEGGTLIIGSGEATIVYGNGQKCAAPVWGAAIEGSSDPAAVVKAMTRAGKSVSVRSRRVA